MLTVEMYDMIYSFMVPTDFVGFENMKMTSITSYLSDLVRTARKSHVLYYIGDMPIHATVESVPPGRWEEIGTSTKSILYYNSDDNYSDILVDTTRIVSKSKTLWSPDLPVSRKYIFGGVSLSRNTCYFWSNPTVTMVDLRGLVYVDKIGGSFLFMCKSLISVHGMRQMHKLRTIGESCLQSCINLRSIRLDGLVELEEIGSCFMAHCQSIEHFDLADLPSLKSIGKHFLAGALNLSRIRFANLPSLETIGAGFMQKCLSVETLNLRAFSSVRRIGGTFLGDCLSLRSVDMRGLVELEHIGAFFMYRSKSIENVDIRGSINLASIGHTFLKDLDPSVLQYDEYLKRPRKVIRAAICGKPTRTLDKENSINPWEGDYTFTDPDYAIIPLHSD
jgi:hypothetical protein